MNTQNPYEALLKIVEEINSVREKSVLLDRIMDIAMATVNAERGFILLKSDENVKNFDVVCARNISQDTISSIRKPSSSVVQRVLSSREPILTMDAQADERFAGAESIVLQQIKSVACTPLVNEHGEVIGAIYIDSHAGAEEFTEETIQFLKAFAKQAAIALETTRVLEKLKMENRTLKRKIEITQFFPEMIGKSPPIIRIMEMIRDVANSTATVLIEGESGTGKELVARAIHFNSDRSTQPFIPIFCGNLAENLLESELFGHRKGAFTGAIENKKGLFEEADGGTIFLDEIADISPLIQVKLLRVLQEGEFKRVGESQIRKVDVRIVAATNKDLWKEVETGNFREDLYYRLNVIHIQMPPLRERREDIPLLAEHFLRKYATKNKKHLKGFTREALEFLMDYHWPGNIRELENAVERAVILSRGSELTPDLFQLTRPRPAIMVGKTLKEIEKEVVLQTLQMTGNNRTRTAEILGVSRRWLQYQLKKWGVINEN